MIDDAYMIGDRMLVAPLFEGENGRKITLPEGAWHDFWTGKKLEGRTTFFVSESNQHIPVFVKGGSVLPLAEIGASTQDPISRKLRVRIYGDGSLPWRLEDPSGATMELRWDASQMKGFASGASLPHSRYEISSWEEVV
jgi:hypothetical protein